MQFAFKIFQQSISWPEMRDIWRVGDELDIFDTGWTYDHLVGMEPTHDGVELIPERPSLDGWALLAALAAETKRLRIGNLVSCVAFRHPVVLAKTAATIDEISGGRLELGLGAGWLVAEAEMYGIEFGTLRDRLERLEENVEVTLALFTEDKVDHDGRFYKLRGARIEPKRRPRLWIGGKNEGTLRITAKYADAWNYSGVLLSDDDLAVFRAKRDYLAEQCVAVGRDPKDVLVTAEFAVRGDPKAVTEAAAKWAEAGAEHIGVMLPESPNPKQLEALATALEPLRAR